MQCDSGAGVVLFHAIYTTKDSSSASSLSDQADGVEWWASSPVSRFRRIFCEKTCLLAVNIG